MGRPPQRVPRKATEHRPYLRLPPAMLAQLDQKAKLAYRDVSGEIAVALRAYLDEHRAPKRLPIADAPDTAHARFRPRLPAAMIREVDERAGADARERTILAAVAWWVRSDRHV